MKNKKTDAKKRMAYIGLWVCFLEMLSVISSIFFLAGWLSEAVEITRTVNDFSGIMNVFTLPLVLALVFTTILLYEAKNIERKLKEAKQA